MDQYLYHYTHTMSLIEILGCRRIKATAISHLNDMSEMEIFGRLPGKISEEEERAKGNKRSVLRKELSGTIFAFCLSEEGNLLSQWRGYCPNGGYSIGFCRKELKKDVNSSSASLVKCEYIDVTSTKDPKNIANEMNQEKEKKDEKEKEETILLDADGEEGKRLTEQWFNKILIKASRMKNACFHEEKEWRILKIQKKGKEGTKFRNGKYGLTPYIEIPFRRESVRKIYVGPGIEKEFAEDTLKQYLRIEGYDVNKIKIEISTIPLR